MEEDVRDAAIDALVTVLTDVIEVAHELAVSAWPTTNSGAHERIEQLVAAWREFVALSEALKVIQIRSEKAETQGLDDGRNRRKNIR